MPPPAVGGLHKPFDHYTSLSEIPKPELPIAEILKEAHTRWLRPLEVYDILSNYQHYNFKLNKEAPVLPKSGQLYLFDRKEVRYFRKDGHVWTKKKDGKAVQEAHEKLKVGSLEILHCYYAHSEKDDRFQRRCYWMLDEARERVVLVHYLQVTEAAHPGDHLQPLGLLPRKALLHPVKRIPASESSQGSESEEDRASPNAVLPHPARPRKALPKRHSFAGGHKGTKRHADDGEGIPADPHRVPKSEPASDGSSQGTGKARRHGEEGNGAQARGENQETGLTKQGSQDLTSVGGALEAAVRDGVFQMEVDMSRPNGGAALDALGDVAWQDWQQQQKVSAAGGYPWDVPAGPPSWPVAPETTAPFPWDPREEPWQGLPRQESAGNLAPPPPLLLPADPGAATGMELWDANNWGGAPPLEGASEAALWLKGEDERAPAAQMVPVTSADVAPNAVLLNTPSGDWTASWSGGTPAAALDLSRAWPDAARTSWPPAGAPPSVWVPTQPPPAHEMPIVHEPGPATGAPSGKPPRPPSLPRLRPLKNLRALAVPDGAAHSGVGVGSPFLVPESPTVVQVLREMHTDAGSRPGSAAPIPEEAERNEFEERKDEEGAQMEEAGPDERAGGHARSAGQQLPWFEIQDCSPEWDYSVGGAKVLLVGTWHLPDDSPPGASDDFRASVTFGGAEVPAEPVGPCLRCTAPAHMPGRVPLCVTFGENQPASASREFEYRPSPVAYVTRRSAAGGGALAVEDAVDEDDDAALQVRLARLLLEGGAGEGGNSDGEEWEELLRTERVTGCVQDGLLQRVLRHVLHLWLARAGQGDPLTYDGYAPFGRAGDAAPGGLTGLNEVGLSALHMAAALGYEWAVTALVDAGCPVDLKDARGRTALHWAAARGREKVVAQLLTHGAAPGMLATKGGCTPADLAATCGHAGIAAFLAECALNRSLSNMTINEDMAAASDAAEAGAAAVAVATGSQGVPRGSDAGLENALEAVRNAARAAALIQSAYRRRRRQRQQRAQQGRIPGEGERDEAADGMNGMAGGVEEQQKMETEHQAATRIQGAFRKFADRKEFLSFRNKVVRLQAAVRGYLQRQKYRRMLIGGAYGWRLRSADKRPRSARYHVDETELPPLPSPLGEAAGEEWRNVGGTDSNYALDRAVTRVQAMVRSRQARAQYLRLRQASQSMQVEHWQHQHGVMQEPHVRFAEASDVFDPSVYLV